MTLLLIALLAAADGLVPPRHDEPAPRPAPAGDQTAAAPAAPPRPAEGDLVGSLRERGTRRKLLGIEITAGGISSITDREGRFELLGLAEGKHQVTVVAPGYKRLEVAESIAGSQRLEVDYLVDPLFGSPYEATVSGERTRREISRTSISMEEIARIPGTQGDALKVIEDLPGVARTSPIGGGMLVIRGSKPGDSSVFLDGEPLPLLYHFGNLSSTVNSDLLAGIDFMPGNFGSSFGDLTGGLVEVRTRSPREELHGYANLNILESSALLEGSIAPGLTFAVAGRRSYMELLLKPVVGSSASFTAAPRYYDGQVLLSWRPQGSAHQFSFLALTSDDQLGLLFKRPISDDPNQTGGFDFQTGFTQLRLKHHWGSGGFGVDSIAMFEARSGLQHFGVETIDGRGKSFMLRSTATMEVVPEVVVASGVDLRFERYTLSAFLPKGAFRLEGEPQVGRPDEAPTQLPTTRYDRIAPGVWAEARWRPLPGLSITPGVRLDAFAYDTGTAHTTLTVSPRLAVRWEALPELALKGGAGLYTQGARNSEPLPVFGNPAIQPERALQITAGAEVRPLPGFFVSAEGFWKKLDDLVVHTGALDLQGNAINLDNAGRGHVYGLELLVRKELTARAFGWIAYTFSRSDRIDRPGAALRLFDFDQTHNLTAVAGYKLGRGWQVGLRFRLISGNPITPVTGSSYLATTDSYLPIYGATNTARAPAFSQLDVRVDKTWTYDAWTLSAYLDVLNATNHRSIEGDAWSYDFSQRARVEGLPILPTLGLKAAF